MVELSAAAPWWQRTVVYQIYPRSFADSNGDGIGDLQGIIDRLDYLRDLGVETLWLSPFYKSPQRDFGYDISSHYELASEHGTLDDCRRLFDAAHARGLRVVLDMVLNHTSSEHPWFLESRSSRDSDKRDFYIWRPGRRPGGKAPPNNWRSMIGPRGWHYDPLTDEWYFASFLPFQPDLNWRNPRLKAAMLDVVRHWLRAGADGLRLDIFNALFKDPGFPDNPPSLRALPSEDNPDGFFQRNLYTINHPDTLAFARELRAVVDEFQDPPRFLVGEVFGAPELLRRYCTSQRELSDGLHRVFLFKTMRTAVTAPALRALLAEYEREFPAPLCPTWVLGNHDRPRVSERVDGDERKLRVLATVQLTARGVPFVYQGEELGMRNLDLPLVGALDPLAAGYRFVPRPVVRALRRRGVQINRDECRAPMQWSAAPNAGFSPRPDARPWLPVHPDYPYRNVEAYSRDPGSLLSLYRRLLALRGARPALHAGELRLWDAARTLPAVLGYQRRAGGDALDVLINCQDDEGSCELGPRAGPVLLSTHGEALRDARRLRLRPYEALVIESG
jgi:oligo-1,6-glucosidase/alpha-glucosidase